MTNEKTSGIPYMPPKIKSVEYGTPDWLFEPFHKKYDLTIDVAASHKLHKCDRYLTKEEDGLSRSWRGERVWCNPPHDAASLHAWVRKAYEETRADHTYACVLVPAKTDQAWWHDYALKAQRHFVKGRVQFEGCTHGDMKSIIVLVFGRGIRKTAHSIAKPKSKKKRAKK